MSIKFKLSEDGERVLELVENDRGQWESSAASAFVGYDGENMLVIVPMAMQSGTWDVVVVHSVVDSPSRVVQGSAHRSELITLVNELVSRVYQS